MKKVKYGDVFEIATKNGNGFFQCVKEVDNTRCEIIRILPGVYKEYEVNIDELVNEKEAFFIQFPLKYALRNKQVKLVGNYTVPTNVLVPRYYRDKHIVKGEFISWHIINYETLKIKSLKELSDEEKKLSPAGIWNDTLLAERIADGWKPENWY